MNTELSSVPSPMSLLLIQAGGGFLALIPIISIRSFSNLAEWLYWTIVFLSFSNFLASSGLVFAHWRELKPFTTFLERVGQLGFCRIVIFYDIAMLGMLVFATGGSDQSVFTAQFAAILPIAVLIKDIAFVKWAYAAFFLLMFLVGLDPLDAFEGYLLDAAATKERWRLVFFFLFTLFPVAYSIMAQRE